MNGSNNECYAITEKGSGSDVNRSINSTAELVGNQYIINGEKWYVTSANKADFFFLQAKIKNGKNDQNHALFIVDKESLGIAKWFSGACTLSVESVPLLSLSKSVRKFFASSSVICTVDSILRLVTVLNE